MKHGRFGSFYSPWRIASEESALYVLSPAPALRELPTHSGDVLQHSDRSSRVHVHEVRHTTDTTRHFPHQLRILLDRKKCWPSTFPTIVLPVFMIIVT